MKPDKIPDAATPECNGLDLLVGTEFLKEKSAARKYDLWRISLRLKPGSVPLQSVKRVIYNLPAGFPAPSRMAREGDFLLRFECWGILEVVVCVFLEKGPPIYFHKSLQWNDPGGNPVPGWLACPDDPESLWRLGRRLISINAFRLAREKLQAARKIADRYAAGTPQALYKDAIIHELVFSTYKDYGARPEERLNEAFDLLKSHWSLETCGDPEIQGLAGAIQKRLWRVTGQDGALQAAARFYRKGFDLALTLFGNGNGNPGFVGVNAAYMLDLQAKVEMLACRRTGIRPGMAWSLRKEAEKIRYHILGLLEKDVLERASSGAGKAPDWWEWATLAEAHIGTGNYDKGRQYLIRGMDQGQVEEWQRESSFTQMADVLRLREEAVEREKNWEEEEPEVWRRVKKGIEAAFPKKAEGHDPADAQVNRILREEMPGKLGLALSGGGFRASLFHIGVLARLAELGILRHLEVLSCVSGGSIIGARYYLEVRRRLEEVPDEEITDDLYLEIVERLQTGFLQAVQSNIRTRVLADFRVHWRVAFSPQTYSWTEALGKLYESEIFRPVGASGGDREDPTLQWLNALFIQPKGADECGFSPGLQNWSRGAKVPILILNATALNTGHNWQFTPSFMGEPPDRIEGEIDSNDRLRRLYYFEAPAEHRFAGLGRAVAASSCVPGLFDPIVLKGLYPDGKVVTLVDGGVHDNQGAQGLLDQDCTTLLISDASGQIPSENAPSRRPFPVLIRSDEILQARLRLSQFLEMAYRKKAALVKDKLFIHLKTGLRGKDVNWIGHSGDEDSGMRNSSDAAPRHGLAPNLQEKVASLRTDLDSFTDAEAYALMYAGYKLTETEFPKQIAWPFEDTGRRVNWKFLGILPWMEGKPGPGASPSWNFERRLEVGKERALKIFRLKPWLRLPALAAILAPIAAVVWLAMRVEALGFFLAALVGIVLSFLLLYLSGLLIRQLPGGLGKFGENLSRVGFGLFMGTAGWIPFKLYLIFLHGPWLASGRLPSMIASEKRGAPVPIAGPSSTGA